MMWLIERRFRHVDRSVGRLHPAEGHDRNLELCLDLRGVLGPAGLPEHAHGLFHDPAEPNYLGPQDAQFGMGLDGRRTASGGDRGRA
jgi:hypothetical protein